MARAFAQAFEWGGNRLDFFFANAGIGDTDSMYKDLGIDTRIGLPKPLNRRSLHVNLLAVIQGVHLARHFLVEKNSKPGGKIVVTSSALSFYANYALPQFRSSEDLLVGTVPLRAPVYAKDNVTLDSLNPALVENDLRQEEASKRASRGEKAQHVTPMPTVLKAVDIIVTNANWRTGSGLVADAGSHSCKAAAEDIESEKATQV